MILSFVCDGCFFAGQVENISAHGKNIPSAKKGRACPAGAFGQGPNRPRVLVTTASQATAQAAAGDMSSLLREEGRILWRELRKLCMHACRLRKGKQKRKENVGY